MSGEARGGVPDGWTEHRRADGERVGWVRSDGEQWTAMDVLGREVVASVDWLDAESALEERGLSLLADPWMLDREDGRALRVRLVEVTPARIVVKAEDYGDVTRGPEQWTLPWPIPAELREPRADDPDAFTLAR